MSWDFSFSLPHHSLHHLFSCSLPFPPPILPLHPSLFHLALSLSSKERMHVDCYADAYGMQVVAMAFPPSSLNQRWHLCVLRTPRTISPVSGTLGPALIALCGDNYLNNTLRLPEGRRRSLGEIAVVLFVENGVTDDSMDVVSLLLSLLPSFHPTVA